MTSLYVGQVTKIIYFIGDTNCLLADFFRCYFPEIKRLRPRSPSASACVFCGELIQGSRKMKKCFFMKRGAKYQNLDVKCYVLTPKSKPFVKT